MIYEVSHRTTYRYSQPVSTSHHLLHLLPRQSPYQTCRHSALEIAPDPVIRQTDPDYFGNPTTFLTIQQGHTELTLHTLSVIEVRRRLVPAPERTPPWEEVRARFAADRAADTLDALQFTFASPYTPYVRELQAFARGSFPPGRPFLAGARDLTHRIHRHFTYDSGATTVATTVAESFALKRGVCQDFAHVQLACLRALGLPARYVSGYLLTRPPEGRERLTGADASHAWLAVWLPDQGWIDLDPTNDLIPGDEHITLAWGRDYGDVSPVVGVMFGGGAHHVAVAVDVVPLDLPRPAPSAAPAPSAGPTATART